MNSYKTGLFAEFLARWYLRLHGYRILKTRYVTGRYTGRAEIDIIAKKQNIIVFVEVKKRPNLTTAFEAISYTQINRLRNSAETFLTNIKWTGLSRFDVIVITKKRIFWIKKAI